MSAVLLKYLGAGVVLVAVYWAVLFMTQRRLMFPAPVMLNSDAPPPAGVRQIWLNSSAGRVEAWLLPPLVPVESPTPLLMFAHGNAELIDDWADAFDEPRRWGMAVLLVEYPGYGRSAGRSSEATIRASFRAAYDWAVADGSMDPDRIVGYGRSVGGGAIAGLSRERRFAALILESSFTSTRPFARRFGAPGFLVRDPFDNVTAVEAFVGPLLVIHGTHDDVVPVEHGRRLARAGGVELAEVPCGHNDCGRSWPLIKTFIVDARIVTVTLTP